MAARKANLQAFLILAGDFVVARPSPHVGRKADSPVLHCDWHDGLDLLSLSEQSRPDPYLGRAFFDCDLEIIRHAHGKNG